MNQLDLSAQLIELEPLRHTPAGIPIIRLRLAHTSEVQELEHLRKLQMEIRAVALGDMATKLHRAKLGDSYIFSGFLAPIKKDSDYLIFHIQTLKGTNHGI